MPPTLSKSFAELMLGEQYNWRVLLQTSGVKRLVYVSSIKVNGEATHGGNKFTEIDSPNPQDPYGVSKWEAEQALHCIAAETGLEIVIVRPPLVYGPGVKATLYRC